MDSSDVHGGEVPLGADAAPDMRQPWIIEAEATRDYENEHRDEWTPALLKRRHAEIWANCPTCRVKRVIPLDSLAARADQPVAGLKVRCHTCEGLGELIVTWISERGTPCFHNFATGDAQHRWRGPFLVTKGPTAARKPGNGAMYNKDAVWRDPPKRMADYRAEGRNARDMGLVETACPYQDKPREWWLEGWRGSKPPHPLDR